MDRITVHLVILYCLNLFTLCVVFTIPFVLRFVLINDPKSCSVFDTSKENQEPVGPDVTKDTFSGEHMNRIRRELQVGLPIAKIKNGAVKKTKSENDDFIWIPSHSWVPIPAINDFCKKSQEYCPPAAKGEKGDSGTDGVPGNPGKDGVPGDPGTPGPPGLPGIKGPAGPKGLLGFPGPQGPTGAPGWNGTAGVPGRKGKRGRRGVPGQKGQKGETGVAGRRGLKGDSGEKGVIEIRTVQQPIKGDEIIYPESSTSSPIDTTTHNLTALDFEGKSCMLVGINNPSILVKGLRTFWGCVMQDSEPITYNDGDKYWLTEHFEGHLLYEYANHADLKNGVRSNLYRLERQYFGTGSVVYRGHFYYHQVGTNKVVKYSLAERKITARGKLRGAVHKTSSDPGFYLFGLRYNFFKLAIDQNGLWVVYSGRKMNLLFVAKLDPDTLAVERIYEIKVQRQEYTDCFIICGMLYLVRSSDDVTMIDFAFDLLTKSRIPLRIYFVNTFVDNTAVSYSHRLKKLYSWNKSTVMEYQVLIDTYRI